MEEINYKIIQAITRRFPQEHRLDLFQEGCLAWVSGETTRLYHRMDGGGGV